MAATEGRRETEPQNQESHGPSKEEPAKYEKALKALVALALPVIVSLVSWWATGTYNEEEFGLQVFALINGLAIYVVPNAKA